MIGQFMTKLSRGGVLILFIACTVGAAARENDWPQFRGPGGQGISNETGLPAKWSATENIAWKTALPGPGTSSPVLLGQRIFLTCYSGYNVPGEGPGDPTRLRRHLVCLDRASGKILWEKQVPAALPEQGTIREGHGYASSTPAADGEGVVVFFGKSGVFAFDHEGRQIWQADVGSGLNGWGSAASPVLLGGLVIINASVESESLVALDRKTGKEVWRAGGIKESWNTPLPVSVNGKTELAVAMIGKILGFDPETGQLLWSCATDIAWYMVPSLSAHEGVIYCIGGRSGGALAVRAGGRGDVTRSHRLWTGRNGSNVSSPVFHDGHLYWMHENQGIAYCAEAASGRIVYSERVPRADQIYSAAVLGDGKIYYLSRSGRVFVVPAAPTFELLATNTLEERGTFNSSPAVGGGRIYIRSDKFLYCIRGAE